MATGSSSSIFLNGDATTELLIDGTGSRLDGGFQTIAGENSQGRITVRNSGQFNGSFGLLAGFGNGSVGTISFESGAQGNAPVVALGVLQGATGSPSVSGAGTRLVVTVHLGLGGASLGQSGGTGTLAISDGGVVDTPRSGSGPPAAACVSTAACCWCRAARWRWPAAARTR